MNESTERLAETIERLERLLPLVNSPTPSNTSSSNFNINGGGWLNAMALVFMAGIALAMFILYLSDRDSAARERQDFRQQARVDIQRIDGTLNRQAEKLETHDAYINDMFRRMKDK